MLEDRVILKDGGVFVVSDLYGDIPAANSLGLGLYRSDTRFLSSFETRLNGRRPILLNRSTERGYVSLFQMVNPKLETTTGRIVPMQTLSLRRTRFLRNGIHERIALQNCGQEEVDVELELSFGADFLDIFEVRGFEPANLPRERAVELESTETGLCFRYVGADGIVRRTEVVVHPQLHIKHSTATVPISLRPQETFVLVTDILPLFEDEHPELDVDFERALDSLDLGYREWKASCSAVRSDNEQLDRELVARSQADLHMLSNQLPSGLFPTAGVPWYAVPFGRDAIITSLQTLALNPSIARGTLRFLAEHQGRTFDEFREEQPGKILHEMRFGELANLHQVPHTPFFGACDTTPLFLVLLVELLDWTGDVDLLAELLPNALAALEWMDRYGDLDADGFIEYTYHPPGVRNQSWKDSSDSLTEANGQAPPPPIAPIEVQAYAYRAKAGLAAIFRRLRLTELADKLESQARELRRRFEDAFWMPDQRFYAQALNGAKRPVTAISSNVGHALWSGIVQPERAPHVVARLMAPEMYSGWGVRTLSAHAVSYNPMSYHNGSVWPHDNSIIAAGLAGYGFDAQAEVVARGIIEAGIRFPDGRLPELFCGFPRDRRFNSGPAEYLVSCNPQAWASGAAFHFLCTLAGLKADSLGKSITLHPIPTTLYRRLRMEGVEVAGGTLDFTVEQGPDGASVTIDRAPSGVEVSVLA